MTSALEKARPIDSAIAHLEAIAANTACETTHQLACEALAILRQPPASTAVPDSVVEEIAEAMCDFGLPNTYQYLNNTKRRAEIECMQAALQAPAFLAWLGGVGMPPEEYTCECGDAFNKNFRGVCPNCITSMGVVGGKTALEADVINSAECFIGADINVHPTLSRAEAVSQAQRRLEMAVSKYQSARPPSQALVNIKTEG